MTRQKELDGKEGCDVVGYAKDLIVAAACPASSSASVRAKRATRMERL
jgi:hypothetical protein